MAVENEGEMKSRIFISIPSCLSASSEDSRHLQRSNKVGSLNLFNLILRFDLTANGFPL